MAKRQRKSRLIYNGIRLQEEQDWYRDGRKVVLATIRVHESDIFIMEYPDFSEELIEVKNLWRTCCRCKTLVPASKETCRPCDIDILIEDIALTKVRIQDQRDRLAMMEHKLSEMEGT